MSPPGPRDGEGGPKPANVEQVGYQSTITTTSRHTTAGDAHSKGTGRRGGGKTPRGA